MLDLKSLKEKLANDQVEEVIKTLRSEEQSVGDNWRQTIYLLSSRWRSLKKEQLQGTISLSDYHGQIVTIIKIAEHQSPEAYQPGGYGHSLSHLVGFLCIRIRPFLSWYCTTNNPEEVHSAISVKRKGKRVFPD